MNAVVDFPVSATVTQRAAVALGTAEHEINLRELVKASINIVTVTNADGRDEAHRAAMMLRTARTRIAAAGKAAREDATAFSKAVISEERRLVEIIEPEETRVFGLRDVWDAQIAAERQAKIDAERARVDAIGLRINELQHMPLTAVGKPSAVIDQMVSSLMAATPDESYAEFLPEAEKARAGALVALLDALATAVAVETEAARIKAAQDAAAASLAAERLQFEQDRAVLAAAQTAQALAAKTARDTAEAEMQAARAKQAAELAQERAELDALRQKLQAPIEQAPAATPAPVPAAGPARPSDEDLVLGIAAYFAVAEYVAVQWLVEFKAS